MFGTRGAYTAVIAEHHMEAQRFALRAEDLRRVFETAVCDIHQADLATKKKLQYRTPIVQRGTVLGISQAAAEKRALSDAARALAQLWKV
jgi:hypothetical protein